MTTSTRDVADELTLVLAKIKRWTTRAKRAQTALDKLDRQRSRLERRLLAKPEAPTVPAPAPAPAPAAIDSGIPDFLKRKRDGERRDEEAKKAILAEQAERKREKARVRIETMKARKSGETKRMPLSGRDALDAIKG